MKQIKIGIIGAGLIAEEYIKILSKKKNIKILCVISRTKIKSQKLSLKYNIEHHDNKISNLLILEPDIIIIAVNILSTSKVVSELSKFSGIILVEKPLGVNSDETKKILKTLRNNKSNCFVALNRRFYDNIQFVKKILDKDKSPKIISITDQENTIKAKILGHRKKVINNWMFANSIHLIDLIIFFGNSKITKINTYKKRFDKEKIILSDIFFKKKVIAQYKSIWNRPGPWSLSISSSKNYFNFSSIENLEYRTSNNKIKIFKKKDNDDFKPGFKNMIDALLDFYLYKNKNKNINKNKSMIDSLININDYKDLAKTIKQIYF